MSPRPEPDPDMFRGAGVGFLIKVIIKKRPVHFARDACCWSVDVLFFLFIS
jgi:hypothetical protein